MEQVWEASYELLMEILTTPQNILLLLLSWGLVEAFAPFATWVLASKRISNASRTRLYQLSRIGKKLGATIWCLGLVWVPRAQPPLCVNGDTADCQTIIERLTTAVVLGLALSLGHNVIARTFRRVTGKTKSAKIMCANCRRKITVAGLDEACPHCGEKPHEVTRIK